MQEFILSMVQTWKNDYSLPIKEKLSQALAKNGYLTPITEFYAISEFASCISASVLTHLPTVPGNYTSTIQPPVSDEEIREVSHDVEDCTQLKKWLLIEDDPNTDCYEVLVSWSKRNGGDRGKLMDALFKCGAVWLAEFLQMR
jgi:hypothetical protein